MVVGDRIAEIPEDLKQRYLASGLKTAQDMIDQYGLHQVLDKGNPECMHQRVFYEENAFDGSALYCDDCPRHERLGYSPGLKMPFPQDALIRTPNLKLGGGKYYSRKANERGVVENELPISQWEAFNPSQSEFSAMLGFYHRPRLNQYKKFPKE